LRQSKDDHERKRAHQQNEPIGAISTTEGLQTSATTRPITLLCLFTAISKDFINKGGDPLKPEAAGDEAHSNMRMKAHKTREQKLTLYRDIFAEFDIRKRKR
jgi:hypothetical protein